MAKKATKWITFPHSDKTYDYTGSSLKKSWAKLHKGDCEAFPDAGHLKKLVKAHPELEPDGSLDDAAAELQDAWRAYHRGDFGAAIETGLALGQLGYNVANKAANIYATYLETDRDRKLALFLEASKRAEELQKRAGTLANAWYLHAQALGRYGQGLSVAKALAEGLGGKIKASLEKAVAIEIKHADAHIALGAYHSVVVKQLGSMVGKLTYGASKEDGIQHFEIAMKLNPASAIGRIEFANGLVMLYGKAKMAEATRLYEEAANSKPADAMERLDVELAKSEIAA